MKKLIALLLAMSIAGCTCENSGGKCIGIADDPVPGVRYEASTLNIVLGIVFLETVIVPVYVVLAALKCPVEP